jgi:hypothetical protein
MVHILRAVLPAFAAAAASFVIAAAPAAAQTSGNVPSYAVKSEEQIQGRITNIDGKYAIEVRDAHGYVDNVSLHDGTIINPTGITLRAGFPVTIYGEPSGSTFVANEIDTPYHYVPVAYAPYPYWGWGPYPYYGPVVGFRFGYYGWR